MTTEQIQDLWGEDLYKVFGNYIDEEGWLTEEWGKIVEENLSDWDKDYNDNDEKKDVYRIMYSIEFEDDETETKIRPKTI